MKHLFVSMSVKQNLFVSVFVHKCLMMLNDVECTTFKMFVTQISNYFFATSFQLMFYKTLHYRLARALCLLSKLLSSIREFHNKLKKKLKRGRSDRELVLVTKYSGKVSILMVTLYCRNTRILG